MARFIGPLITEKPESHILTDLDLFNRRVYVSNAEKIV